MAPALGAPHARHSPGAECWSSGGRAPAPLPRPLRRLVARQICSSAGQRRLRRLGQPGRAGVVGAAVRHAAGAGPEGCWRPPRRQRRGRDRLVTRAGVPDPLQPLGFDVLTFLASTVLVIPVFKSVNASPVLGFLFAGLVLGQLGLFRSQDELEKLSELGVLFLLFEMGLELSLDRLKALAKYAFGLGSITMLITTVIFTCLGLPPGGGLGTKILVDVFHVPQTLASVNSLDEAIVIGAALSLSSSAFVLQLMNERGELATKTGSATLGILLFQDIAVVPFLVLLPLVENTDLGAASTVSIFQSILPTAATTLAGLGLLLLGGRFILRRIFTLVAEARSDETFVALCLLTVTGTALVTQRLGFSDTMGAFVAGVLLAETNYRTQVEADIRPFRGMLLGLFFVTTGASLDVGLFLREWPIVVALLGGLIAIKIGVIGASGPLVGLTKAESIRTAFLLSQGGEFAFVLLSLAAELKVLPQDLNRLLIIVVVLSMALTPLLAELGARAAEAEAAKEEGGGAADESSALEAARKDAKGSQPVVIAGFGELGQTVANMLESPLAGTLGRGPVSYVGFDMQPQRVLRAREAGFKCFYGDASRPSVLEAAGVSPPRAIAVLYTARARSVSTCHTLHEAYPKVPIYARALDSLHAAELRAAGAGVLIVANTEAGLELGGAILQDLGCNLSALRVLTGALRKQMDNRIGQLAEEIQADEQAVTQLSPDDICFHADMGKLAPEEDGASSFLAPTTEVALQRAATAEDRAQRGAGPMGFSQAEQKTDNGATSSRGKAAKGEGKGKEDGGEPHASASSSGSHAEGEGRGSGHGGEGQGHRGLERERGLSSIRPAVAQVRGLEAGAARPPQEPPRARAMAGSGRGPGSFEEDQA